MVTLILSLALLVADWTKRTRATFSSWSGFLQLQRVKNRDWENGSFISTQRTPCLISQVYISANSLCNTGMPAALNSVEKLHQLGVLESVAFVPIAWIETGMKICKRQKVFFACFHNLPRTTNSLCSGAMWGDFGFSCSALVSFGQMFWRRVLASCGAGDGRDVRSVEDRTRNKTCKTNCKKVLELEFAYHNIISSYLFTLRNKHQFELWNSAMMPTMSGHQMKSRRRNHRTRLNPTALKLEVSENLPLDLQVDFFVYRNRLFHKIEQVLSTLQLQP